VTEKGIGLPPRFGHESGAIEIANRHWFEGPAMHRLFRVAVQQSDPDLGMKRALSGHFLARLYQLRLEGQNIPENASPFPSPGIRIGTHGRAD
jgi:hypothetical protein